MAKGSPLVLLVLEEIGVNRADPHAVPARKAGHFLRILAGREIPQHVHRNRGAAARQRMHMAGVCQLVAEIDRCRILEELAKAGAGVGESPGGSLDGETVEHRKQAGSKGGGGHRRKMC